VYSNKCSNRKIYLLLMYCAKLLISNLVSQLKVCNKCKALVKCCTAAWNYISRNKTWVFFGLQQSSPMESVLPPPLPFFLQFFSFHNFKHTLSIFSILFQFLSTLYQLLTYFSSFLNFKHSFCTFSILSKFLAHFPNFQHTFSIFLA